MLDMLERSESKVLGVVMTDESTFDHFAQRDQVKIEAAPATERRPAEVLAERFEDVRNRFQKAI
jgi:hypothetical protein